MTKISISDWPEGARGHSFFGANVWPSHEQINFQFPFHLKQPGETGLYDSDQITNQHLEYKVTKSANMNNLILQGSVSSENVSFLSRFSLGLMC